jgi:voltage-gated potassium channel
MLSARRLAIIPLMPVEFDRHIYRKLLLAVVVVLSVGTIFYHFQEHLSWVDAYYFCVVTLATVGYGDITPHTDLGKLFTTLYIFIGVGIITTFFTYSLRRRATKRSDRHADKVTKKSASKS